MVTRKSTIEIIEETIAYYSEDVKRRAMSDYGCFYQMNDGRMCAVGRCLSNPTLIEQMVQEVEDGAASVNLLNDNLGGTFDSYLKEEYQEHELYFWQQLQELHDYNYHWNSEGLTKEGLYAVEKLKEKYSDNK